MGLPLPDTTPVARAPASESKLRLWDGGVKENMEPCRLRMVGAEGVEPSPDGHLVYRAYKASGHASGRADELSE